jgi:hypothetical protein
MTLTVTKRRSDRILCASVPQLRVLALILDTFVQFEQPLKPDVADRLCHHKPLQAFR